jgi:hypothetical protein
LIYTLAVIGLFVVFVSISFFGFAVYSVFRAQRSPADKSNRINKLILIWFAFTREDLFVEILPFLKRDLMENFNGRN